MNDLFYWLLERDYKQKYSHFRSTFHTFWTESTLLVCCFITSCQTDWHHSYFFTYLTSSRKWSNSISPLIKIIHEENNNKFLEHRMMSSPQKRKSRNCKYFTSFLVTALCFCDCMEFNSFPNWNCISVLSAWCGKALSPHHTFIIRASVTLLHSSEMEVEKGSDIHRR